MFRDRNDFLHNVYDYVKDGQIYEIPDNTADADTCVDSVEVFAPPNYRILGPNDMTQKQKKAYTGAYIKGMKELEKNK
jgi:hypothetical protein